MVNPQASRFADFPFLGHNRSMSKTPPPKRIRQIKQPKKGAPIGNKNAEKFSTAAERQKAYRLYCMHLAAGYMGSSFYEPCVEDTVQSLMKKYPDEFDADLLRVARAKGRMYWEDVGNKGTIGKIKGFNAHSWKYNMANRLGWKDRSEHGFDDNTRAIFTMKSAKDLSGVKPDDE